MNKKLIEDGGPAFAMGITEGVHRTHPAYSQTGMTLRDYFAAAALQGGLSNTETLKAGAALADRCEAVTLEQIMAIRSYAFADAMIKARTEAEP